MNNTFCKFSMFLSVFISTAFSVESITVDLANDQQVLFGNGINFEGYHRNGGSEVLASKFESMLDGMKSDLLRLGMPLQEWEPTNDNNDPTIFESSGFKDQDGPHNCFLRMQELNNRGYSLWMAVWDVADWNVSNPSNNAQRKIENMDEFVESICAFLKTAKDNYSVIPEFVSVNEPSIADENGWGGYQLALTAEEQASLIKKAGARFEQMGITTNG